LDWTTLPLNMKPIGNPETSVLNHLTPCNNLEDRRINLNCGVSLRPCIDHARIFMVHLTTLPNTQDYVASNGKMVDQWWIGMDAKGRNHALVQGIFRQSLVPSRAKESYRKPWSWWKVPTLRFEPLTSRINKNATDLTQSSLTISLSAPFKTITIHDTIYISFEAM
jgi:hypothetical protein